MARMRRAAMNADDEVENKLREAELKRHTRERGLGFDELLDLGETLARYSTHSNGH